MIDGQFACRKVERQKRQQQGDASRHRVDEELERGAIGFRTTPAFDQEEGLQVAWNELRPPPESHLSKTIGEIEILRTLRHPSIISLLHTWVEKEQIIFITELMTSGTLKSFIKKVKNIKLKVIKGWARQIAAGLDYLHSRSPAIIHRDLKCENIFINGNNGQLKIGDLGLATVKGKKRSLNVLGTPEFMAPELYDEEYDENENYEDAEEEVDERDEEADTTDTVTTKDSAVAISTADSMSFA